MGDTIIKTNNIVKKYGSSFALNNVNLNVKAGQIYGLIGKNGAGKTTLFKIFSGLTIQSAGDLELFGKGAEKELLQERRRIGCIIETPAFFPYLSAEKNLEYYRLQRGIPGKKCIGEVLEMVELADTGKKKYRDFSLGMKQRLGLALAMMGKPDLLILDEPINGLDPIGIVKIRELLKRLHSERNITIIISSHILGELSQLATAYGFIDNGEILEESTSEKVNEKCRQCLVLKVNDPQRAVVFLENKLNCRQYEVLNDSSIRVCNFNDKSDLITQTLVENGVGVYSVSSRGMTLEEYFMQLIGGKQND